jgi:uncharacterized membrane protein YkoI
MRIALLITALATMLPLGGTAVLADSIAQSGHLQANLVGFHGTAASLPDAIAKVERATGGKVIEIRFDDSDGMPGYHAVVDRGSAVEFMHLDVMSGRLVIMRDNVRPAWMLSWRDQAELRVAETARVPLTKAIATAEQAGGNAPAIAAGVAHSARNPQSDVHAYNVLIDRGGSVQRQAVDSATDNIIADAGALNAYP